MTDEDEIGPTGHEALLAMPAEDDKPRLCVDCEHWQYTHIFHGERHGKCASREVQQRTAGCWWPRRDFRCGWWEGREK